MGRPLKFTGRDKAQIVRLVTTGWPLHLVATRLKCNVDTIDAERHRDPDFAAAVKAALEARGGRIRKRLGDIAEAGDAGNPVTIKAIQIYLAAKYPNEFGNRVKVEGGAPLEVLILQSYRTEGTGTTATPAADLSPGGTHSEDDGE